MTEPTEADVRASVEKLRGVFPEKTDAEIADWLRSALRYMESWQVAPRVPWEPPD